MDGLLYDVVIIGGGVNGCGCAADAAMRGLSVLLCEQNDLASKTSSSSSQLIHGGLRYLEYYDFSLVKKARDEQQILMQIAPNLIHPVPFILPHNKNGRPNWILRLGLFLYDHLSWKNKLPNSRYITVKNDANYFKPLASDITDGFVYYDCMTDDARLTITNALQAKKHGAKIMTQTSLVRAQVHDDQWQLTLKPKFSTKLLQVHAKTVINAAGPWVNEVNHLLQIPTDHTMLHVKGSHLVINKLYDGDHAYVLQHRDKRIVFVLPYHNHTLIGTTEVMQNGVLNDLQIEKEEIDYLCELVNQQFKKKITEKEIIHTWSGVRPLLSAIGKKPTAVSRDYAYHYHHQPAPSITIYGGKITTYRKLAVSVINELKTVFPNLSASQTASTCLPGAQDYATYRKHAQQKYAWLDRKTLERYLNTYGTITDELLKNCSSINDLGICFMPTLYQVEVDYLMREEWAVSAEDIVWRRTKLGLTMDKTQYETLQNYLV